MLPSARASLRQWLVLKTLCNATLLWLAICSAACSKTLPPPRPVLVNQLVCLKDPPPRFPALVVDGIRQDGCPSEYVCLTRPAAAALAIWLRSTLAWLADAYQHCGPLPGGPVPHMQDG